MAQTGKPTTAEPWYAAQKKVVERDIMEAIKEANEQAGLAGLRWSTPLARSAQDIAGKYMTQLGADYASK
jgi:hypothetical protein